MQNQTDNQTASATPVKMRDVEAMYQALVADNEARKVRGLPTFEPTYELAQKALINATPKRTIPAEKPTAQNWRQALQDWYLSACKGRQEANTQVALLQAHAAQLAEALRISTTTLETVYGNDKKNIAAKCSVERNRKALAAYEEAK